MRWIMEFEQLKEKAASLPLSPGVYIMRDRTGQVIYVGKAKKLKNRVSQYFLNSASHTPKTRLMVSKIFEFDVIIAASEFEALVLECSLIKRHMPKYNILLKDDKGYPYLRLDEREAYPIITLVSKIANDGAQYYGPYGSRGVTQSVLESIRAVLKLPNCHKKFPRDIGKERPCLHYHMNQCAGWCQGSLSAEVYRGTIQQAKHLLTGNFRLVADETRLQMLEAAEDLNFELAASLRDRLQAIEALGQKQLVTAGTLADTDVIGFQQTETKACFSVLHFSGGNLLDKDYEILPAQEDPENAVSSLLKQYYLSRGYAPKVILLPFELEDSQLFAELLLQNYGKKTHIRMPQRGDNAKLVELARKNAIEEANRVTSREERLHSSLILLGKMLGVEPPSRIESFDISNISGTDIVASMVVFQDGRPRKSDYKRFKVENMVNQDDYASMYQVVSRRFAHYLAGDKGFETAPDLLLIDGGAVHAETVCRALSEMGLSFPVIGMVKDERHRTRALITADGNTVDIAAQQSVYALVGNIQEETHRFAITYHRNLRSKRLQYSTLDEITGIGPKRKQLLLKTFGSLTAISQASLDDLKRILPADAAMAVYQYFQERGERNASNFRKGQGHSAENA